MIGTGRAAPGHPAVHRPRSQRHRRSYPPRPAVSAPSSYSTRRTPADTSFGLAGGPEKVARVAANGADLAVDYNQDNFGPPRSATTSAAVRATVVFDSVGGVTARPAVGLLGKGGQHIVFGWSGEGLHDGWALTFTPEELAERGITSEGVLGPVMMQRAGGLPSAPWRTAPSRRPHRAGSAPQSSATRSRRPSGPPRPGDAAPRWARSS